MTLPVKILIVEDEAFTAMVLKMDVGRAGYAMCGLAATGQEAIRNAAQEQPDVILMDIHLSGELDGIEAAQEILTEREVPIIFMTGYDDPVIKQRAIRLQPAAYLIKPVRLNDIRAALESALPHCHPGKA